MIKKNEAKKVLVAFLVKPKTDFLFNLCLTGFHSFLILPIMFIRFYYELLRALINLDSKKHDEFIFIVNLRTVRIHYLIGLSKNNFKINKDEYLKIDLEGIIFK